MKFYFVVAAPKMDRVPMFLAPVLVSRFEISKEITDYTHVPTTDFSVYLMRGSLEENIRTHKCISEYHVPKICIEIVQSPADNKNTFSAIYTYATPEYTWSIEIGKRSEWWGELVFKELKVQINWTQKWILDDIRIRFQ